MAGPAAAQTPCNYPSSLGVSIPSKVAVGRSLDLYEYSGGTTDGSITVSLQALDPNRPIRHPFSVVVEYTGDAPPIQFARGDGPAQLTISGDCMEPLSRTLVPFPGQEPRINVHRAQGGEILVFEDRSCPGDPAKAATGTTTITVRGNGKTRRTSLEDQCTTDWHPLFSAAKGWQLSYRFDYESMIFRALTSLGLGEHRFHYVVRYRHRKLEFGSFTTVVKRNPLYCAIYGC